MKEIQSYGNTIIRWLNTWRNRRKSDLKYKEKNLNCLQHHQSMLSSKTVGDIHLEIG